MIIGKSQGTKMANKKKTAPKKTAKKATTIKRGPGRPAIKKKIA